MKGLMKIEGVGRLPFTNICPEKAATLHFLRPFGSPSGESNDKESAGASRKPRP
jgi:hypothetical protein